MSPSKAELTLQVHPNYILIVYYICKDTIINYIIIIIIIIKMGGKVRTIQLGIMFKTAAWYSSELALYRLVQSGLIQAEGQTHTHLASHHYYCKISEIWHSGGTQVYCTCGLYLLIADGWKILAVTLNSNSLTHDSISKSVTVRSCIGIYVVLKSVSTTRSRDFPSSSALPVSQPMEILWTQSC